MKAANRRTSIELIVLAHLARRAVVVRVAAITVGVGVQAAVVVGPVAAVDASIILVIERRTVRTKQSAFLFLRNATNLYE